METTFKIKCKECNKYVANSNNVLGMHLRKEHKIEYQDYIVKHEYDNIWPICLCGCNEKLIWKKGGFSRFKKNHSSRDKHNVMYGKKRTNEQKKKYSKAAFKRWQTKKDI
jgi:hypothetical protein